MTSPPVVSIVTPVYRPDLAHFKACVASVFAQTAEDWQLILVDDASGDEGLSKLLDRYALDPRVVVHTRSENGGIVAASNDALKLANGRLIAFLDHDDVLRPFAVEKVELHAAANPAAEVIYSDRGHIDASDNRVASNFFKPTWSPERLRGGMYIAHLTVVSREAALAVGGFRSEFEGSQDYDLVLRITERGKPIVHIPKILYQWRATEHSTAMNPDAKPYAREAGLRAVQAHCDRVGIDATVEQASLAGSYVLKRRPAPGSKVSIIIPTMGASAEIFGKPRCLPIEAVRSIVQHEYVADYEILVIYDDRGDNDLSYLDELSAVGNGHVQLIPFREPFNFSKKINVGALSATGDVLLLLNDDIEVVSAHWLDHLVAIAQEPDVGSVGAKLLFENDLIQHAGLGVSPPWAVFNANWKSKDTGGYFRTLISDHEVVGVTGACLAVRSDVFFEIGGFCEDFPGAFNDVDFSFKCVLAGYRNVAANSVVLYHFESLTRNPQISLSEHSGLIGRWRSMLQRDPYLRGMSMPAKRND